MRIGMTSVLLDSIAPAAPGRRDMYYDRDSQLALAVTDRGAKIFMLYVSHKGRPLKRKIGDYPRMSINEARVIAAQLVAELLAEKAKEIKDKLEHQQLSSLSSHTVAGLFELYFAGYAHKCKSHADIRYTFEKYLRHRIGAVPAEQLTPSAVADLHRSLTVEHGPTQANRVIQQLRAIYSYGEKHWLYEGRNPTKAVKLNRETPRKRFVEEDELPKLLDAIDRYATPKTRDFFKLCLFTGQRFSNVCKMRWEHIHLERGIWLIPAEQFKNGDPHQVPLTSAAVEILRARRELEKNGWVFPGRRGSGHLVKPHRYWYEICEKAGLPDLRIHDLRRTLATYQTASGTPLRIVGDTLGHKSLSATEIYARAPRKVVADSMEAAVNTMQKRKGEAR